MEIPLDHVESAVAIPSQRQRRYIYRQELLSVGSRVWSQLSVLIDL